MTHADFFVLRTQKMIHTAIDNFHKELAQIKKFGKTENETAIRRAFINLINSYCAPKNLLLIEELKLTASTKIPDGTIKDALNNDWGYWESKDGKDDLRKEIQGKFEIGYPKDNILFEDSETVILFQRGKEVDCASVKETDKFHKLLTTFVEYERPEISEFRSAIEKFKLDIPHILIHLRTLIEEQEKTNEVFKTSRKEFWNLCKHSINPSVTKENVNEMMLQHILTSEIFSSVFDNKDFHRENNIAKELDKVVSTFFIGDVRRNTFSKIDNYYKTIKAKASAITNHSEKQKFLKIIYENFYKAFNPKEADKLGVVYTPNEIVNFQIKASNYLLDKYLGKELSDKGVEIIDPSTGTATYICDILIFLPPDKLKYKYENEIHANEISILPYYVANLNIENTYKQLTGIASEFLNICFVDTLDIVFHRESRTDRGSQQDLFSVSLENIKRIKNQSDKKISVVIGNPPYSANQISENDNNKGREYFNNGIGVDDRIKETYIKFSKAVKPKTDDMYAKFYRWASDRINEDGMVSFITNRSFIEAKSFDGFRKCIRDEFQYAYIIDLGGDIRAGDGTKGNVFGIQTGVAISFFIKKKADSEMPCKIYYNKPDLITAKEKLHYLSIIDFKNISFDKIAPDENNNWLDITDNDFKNLVPLFNKETKLGKKETAVFKSFYWGNSSNRDKWVYDSDKANLEEKVKYFIEHYNKKVDSFINNHRKGADKFHDNKIKWSRDLKNKFNACKKIVFDETKIVTAHWRPFSTTYLYTEKILNDVLTENHYQSFGNGLEKENKVICITNHPQIPFIVHCTNGIVDAGYGSRATHNIPFNLYEYDKETENYNIIDNITDWGLKQFREHYKNENIIKEDIFHYTYSVLHYPAFIQKYEVDLKREFTRIPYYNNFEIWVNWGKELMNLHINYKHQIPYELQVVTDKKIKSPTVRLTVDKKTKDINIDTATKITGIPKEAWEYKLGNRGAIEWVLDQYKANNYNLKEEDENILSEKFNTYKFSDCKDECIYLIKQVCAISIETNMIVSKLQE